MNVHQQPAHLQAADAKHPDARDGAVLAAGIPIAPHREPAEAVVSALGSDAARGLTGAEAQRRLWETSERLTGVRYEALH